jgi:hypothetical protein
MRPSGRLANLRSVCALAAALWAPGLASGQPVGQQYTATWVQSNPGGVAPSARGMVATAYDQANDRLIVSGGNSYGALYNDVWVLHNASQTGSAAVWEQLQPSGQAPPIRETHVAAYDQATNRLVIHGGWPGLSDAWVLTNANGLGGTPEWLPLPAAPVVRASAASAYDADHHRLIVFGGADVNYYTINAWLNDVWILIDADGVGSPTWEQLHPTGTAPTPRAGAATAYDPASNRMIVFGGSDVNGSLNDLWILTNANGMGGAPEWIPVSTASSPSKRTTTMAYDAGAKRAIVVGGGLDSPPLSSEVWVLDNADGTTGAPRWVVASALGAAYDGNLTPVVYSSSMGRLVVALGVLGNGSGYRNDVWLCDVGAAGGQAEVQVHVPPAVVVEATGPAGTAVSYAASATDSSGAAVSVSCTPASGSVFAVGTTIVTCTAVDGVGSGTFGITVQDMTPPALAGIPTDVVVEGPIGASVVVTFTNPTWTDAVAGNGTANCVPASGTLFSPGLTTVSCTATDGTNVVNRTFSVTVQDTMPPVSGQPFEITFFEDGAFTVIDSTGRVTRRTAMPDGGSTYALSADRSKLAYESDGSNIHLYDFGAKADTTLFRADWAQTITWLPGSNTEFFYNTPSGNLLKYNLDTGLTAEWQSNDVLGPFGVNVFRSGPFNWDHALEKVVFFAGVGGGGDNKVLLGRPCELDASHHLCDVTSIGGPTNWWYTINWPADITPDGTKVYYARRVNWSSWEVYERVLATGEERLLVSGTGDPSGYGVTGLSLFGNTQLVLVLPSGDSNGRNIEVCDIGAALSCRVVRTGSWPTGTKTGPVIGPPPRADAGAPQTVEASGPSGATVTLDGSASSDSSGGALSYRWTGPFSEGGGTVAGVGPTVTLPVGTSTVTLMVANGQGESATSAVAITVRDTTPPVLALPSAIAVTATSSAGANVAYHVSATDLVSGDVPVVCTPHSEVVFPVGTTIVSCSATDAAGNVASGSFTVTVREGVTVQLIDSRGVPISGGVVQYYSGSWLPFGTTGSDGRVSLALPLRSYTFRMTYAGGVKDIAQNTAANSVVTYRTANVSVQLKDSSGLPLDVGSVQYYAGSWRPFGTTAGGQVSLELLPVSYTFRMLYAGGIQDKPQNTATGAPVVFQTVTATVRLTNSGGVPLDGGQVQYYAGSWRPFGVTAGGQASLELLPVAYTFRMTFAGGVQDKAQTAASGTVVGFATAPVHSDSGTCTGYYAGAWRSFFQDMELLPTTYVFRFTGSPDTPYTVTTGLTNHIR